MSHRKSTTATAETPRLTKKSVYERSTRTRARYGLPATAGPGAGPEPPGLPMDQT